MEKIKILRPGKKGKRMHRIGSIKKKTTSDIMPRRASVKKKKTYRIRRPKMFTIGIMEKQRRR